MSRRLIARELAEAIRDGLIEGGGHASISQSGFVFSVHCEGFDEPIRVERSNVDFPEWAEPLIPGIRLDRQAVLASFLTS